MLFRSSLLFLEKSPWCSMLCHLPLCSNSSGDCASNSVSLITRVSIVAIDNGLYNTPKGFMLILNLFSASLVPMLLAKHDPASNKLLLWLSLYLLMGSSIAVLKRVIVVKSTQFS